MRLFNNKSDKSSVFSKSALLNIFAQETKKVLELQTKVLDQGFIEEAKLKNGTPPTAYHSGWGVSDADWSDDDGEDEIDSKQVAIDGLQEMIGKALEAYEAYQKLYKSYQKGFQGFHDSVKKDYQEINKNHKEILKLNPNEPKLDTGSVRKISLDQESRQIQVMQFLPLPGHQAYKK